MKNVITIAALVAVVSMLLFALWDKTGWVVLDAGEIGQRGNMAMRTPRAEWAAHRGIIWGQCGKCGKVVIPGVDTSEWDGSIQRHVCRNCKANSVLDRSHPSTVTEQLTKNNP